MRKKNRELKLYRILYLIGIFFFSISFGQSSTTQGIRLYFMGGQSNMEGHGLNKDLPDSLAEINQNIWLYHGVPKDDGDTTGGGGRWVNLQPGNGAGFLSDGSANTYSNKFGPELSFGYRMAQLYPGEKVAIIKYARGGSSIDSASARTTWEMDVRSKGGVNQLDHFLRTLNDALEIRDIDQDGIEDKLIPSGILWMQGESDANRSEQVALDYYQNLKRLMDLIRLAFRDDDLPVVIGKISDSGQVEDGKVWTHCELVQYAQEKYVKDDRNASIIRETRNYDYYDPWHYDTNGYIDMGIRFANEVNRLNQSRKR